MQVSQLVVGRNNENLAEHDIGMPIRSCDVGSKTQLGFDNVGFDWKLLVRT